MRSSAYIRGLTAIRGLAAWWIVSFHMREFLPAATPALLRATAAHGYLAVDLFFILSGFVVALSYGDWFGAVQPAPYFKFLSRRLARIYPLHLFMLLMFVAYAFGINVILKRGGLAGHFTPGYFAQSLLLVQNWGFNNGLEWNYPAWSISTEWFAYLIFPFFMVVLPRIAATPRRLTLCAAALLATLALLCQWQDTNLSGAILHLGLPRCALEFCAGVCLLRLHTLQPSLGRRRAFSIMAAALACLAVTAIFDLPDYVLVPSGFALLIFALADPALALPRAWPWRALEWLGTVSYSTYMVHYLLKMVIKLAIERPGIPMPAILAVYLPVLLAASAILYRAVEVPGRTRFPTLLGRPRPAYTNLH